MVTRLPLCNIKNSRAGGVYKKIVDYLDYLDYLYIYMAQTQYSCGGYKTPKKIYWM